MLSIRSVSLSLLIGAPLLFAACSSGSGRNIGGGGRFCTLEQSSLFTIPVSAEKTSLKPDNTNLPEGNYIYDSAELLYVRKVDPNTPSTWMIIQTVESMNLDTTEQATLAPFCVRGITPSTPTFSIHTQGVSELVSMGGVIDFKGRDYGFTWDQDSYSLKVSTAQLEGDFDHPSKVYEDKATDFNLYKVSASNPADNRYEILSVTESPETNETVYLKVRLRQVDLTTQE